MYKAFLAHLDEVQKSYCTTPGVGVGVGVGVGGGVGVSKMLKFYFKVFYVMGKALSGELSCPCDRSCCFTCVSVFDDLLFRTVILRFFLLLSVHRIDWVL